MTQTEFKKKISRKRSITTAYRNFETWGIAEFDWDKGLLIMTLDGEPREDAQIEIAFRRDTDFITENFWDFFINFDRTTCGFVADELEFFSIILDVLISCEDDYSGKE